MRRETAEHDPNQPLDKGIKRAVWMSYNEILANRDRMRSDLVIKCIEHYQQGHRYPIDLVFK